MKKIKIMLVFASVFCLLNSPTSAQEKPIQLALFNPIQIVPENSSITGLRLNLIYGKNTNVSGVDFGFVNYTTGTQKGIQWGTVNLVDGGMTGWQSAFANISNGNSVGLQTAAVNYHHGHFNGLQIAIVNYSATLKGLQLGLINIIGKGGFLPVFPFFNFDLD